MPAFLFDAPAAWDPSSHAASERSVLGSDQCVIEEEQWFLRGLLSIPVTDGGEDVVFGVWLSVSEGTFDRAVELWENPGRVRDPAYPGWLANDVPGYDPPTTGLLARLRSQPVGKRPLVQLHAVEHPLVVDAENGIDAERATGLIGLARTVIG